MMPLQSVTKYTNQKTAKLPLRPTPNHTKVLTMSVVTRLMPICGHGRGRGGAVVSS